MCQCRDFSKKMIYGNKILIKLEKIMYIFIYHWFVQDELNKEGEKELMIRAYGINQKQETVLLHIKNFKPWMYIEMSKNENTSSEWVSCKSFIKNKIQERCKHLQNSIFYLVYKKKLYFDDDQEYPFFKLRFNTAQTRKNAYYSLQNYTCRSMGRVYSLFCHEEQATPLLQLLVSKNLPSAGWIEFEGRFTPKDDKLSESKLEYHVDYENLTPLDKTKETELGIPTPTVLSFDIETYSSNSQRMPMAENPDDAIFQISCVIQEYQQPLKKYLLTLFRIESKIVGAEVETFCFHNEVDLLLGFTKLIRKTNPHIIIGYNIFGFDLPYMIARCKMHNILSEFDQLGIPLNKHAPEEEIKWSSTAYKYQEFHYLNAEGRLFIDLLPIVRRDYKFNNYKLKTVSTFFLGETKDPLTHYDIFKAYECGKKGEKKKLSECGKYCVQDSALVLKLFNILQLWIGLSEMAKICNVPIMYLFTKGQQIKVFSQIYQKCYNENILVQSMSSNKILDQCAGYSGAYVFPPIPGIYDWVIPFDFSSLYPTTIIAYNIDYSTLVLDESKVDLNNCHIIEWEDHINCEHDTTIKKVTVKNRKLCGKNRFVFRKEPLGVVPSLLKNLLQQRSETKKLMKQCYKENLSKDVLETRVTVLDKRQLAYKLSANSMYGAMGVKKGYLPFMPGAMSTTAMGRMSIQKAAEFVKQKYKGQLVYGDSVIGDTPLSIMKNNSITVVSIQDLFEKYNESKSDYDVFKEGEPGLTNKEKVIPNDPINIMSHNGWSKIKKIIRHFTDKKLYRIITNSGIVDVTEDHSLLNHNLELIKPCECKKDEKLFIYDYEKFWHDTSICLNKNILEKIEITVDGKIIYKNWEKNKEEILSLYLYLNKKFPNLGIDIIDNILFFVPIIKNDGGIIDIIELGYSKDYVYDIETEDGSFHAGIGNLIVKNTDSIYCHFPNYTNAKKSWEMAKIVENQLLTLFPSPMKLVFEEKIYKKFLILTKKRYMAYTCGENGHIDDKLTIRGVLLARRDNCKFIRCVYEKIVRLIMDGESIEKLYDTINDDILELMCWKTMKMNNFTITKQVNKDYKIKSLPTEYKKFKKRLEELNIYNVPKENEFKIEDYNQQLLLNEEDIKSEWLKSYIMRSKPAHIQLANKMTLRGMPVEIGSRLEFLIIKHTDDPKAKLYDKLEDPAYFKNHRDILRLDRLYYLKSLILPLDQLLNVLDNGKDFVSKIYNYHSNRYKIMKEIENKKSPKILIDDEEIKSKKIKSIPKIKKNIYDYF